MQEPRLASLSLHAKLRLKLYTQMKIVIYQIAPYQHGNCSTNRLVLRGDVCSVV